jgi:hypothetical protein
MVKKVVKKSYVAKRPFTLKGKFYAIGDRVRVTEEQKIKLVENYLI